MPSQQERGRSRRLGMIVFSLGILAGASVPARGQTTGVASDQAGGVLASPQAAGYMGGGSGQAMIGPQLTLNQLVRMSRPELDALYQQGTPAPIFDGRVRGRALYPDGPLAVPRSRAARLVWQGKIFQGSQGMAVNKFFGVRAVKARVYQAESWRDGNPALILDYSETSLIYRPYRDEIREVAPGLYLGLMYARTQPQPKLKMYFALEAVR